MSHHILVVDDDVAIRSMIQTVLADEGFATAAAGNGVEALARINEERPKLILLDLQMPGMTGWEVLNHLREAQVTVPVVFMTAGYRARVEAERHGADGYVAKPFALDDLLSAVDRFMAERPASGDSA